MPWQGNINNPIPNEIKEPINRAEKFASDNRSHHVRRDTDSQKNFTITLYDIDKTILTHLEQLNLQVEESGKQIRVPVFFGSPEKWKSIQRDGYMRDNNGNVILPATILKRTSSDRDESLKFLNRYLNTSVRRLYSPKNKYTKFSTLIGQNAPVNEVYNVIIPSHMVLVYHFIIWTESIEQMNHLVESIQFNTNDYWGTENGFKFRTKIDSFSHATELQAGEDRIVKTEFDLSCHGYILPETIQKLDKNESTFQKHFTPKKVIIGAEVVKTDFDMSSLNDNSSKWKNQNYPNLDKSTELPVPPINVVDSIKDSSVAGNIYSTLTQASSNPTVTHEPVSLNTPYLKIVSPPSNYNINDGTEGDVSYDSQYFYIYSNGQWRRVAIADFSNVT